MKGQAGVGGGGGREELISQTSFWLYGLTSGHRWGTWHVPKDNNSSGPVPHFSAHYW